MKVQKALRFLFVIVFVFATLIACSANETSKSNSNNDSENQPQDSSSDTSSESDNDQLKIALSVNPPTLDIQFTTATVTKQIGLHIYETLTTYDENYQNVPLLAEEIDVSDDGKTFTVHLRQGVTFHNGKDMTADDVVASLERWQKISNVGKVAFQTVTSITAKDSSTVEIQSSSPSSILLPALSSPRQPAVIMPKDIVEAAGTEEISEYIGTGPYQFEEWKQDQYVHLIRFEDYKSVSAPPSGLAGKREAVVKNLYFHFVSNAASRIAGLQSGNYDFAEDIPIDNASTLEEDENINLYVGKPSRMNLLFFNNKEGPFTNKKLREAVNAALDLDEIMTVAAVDPDFFRVEPGLMFQEQKDWYVQDGFEKYNQKDTEQAKKLLQEAGYNGEEITILASKEFDYLYNSALLVDQQMQAIGINTKFEVYDWPTLLDRRKDPEKWDIFYTYTGLSAHPTEINYVDSRKGYPGWYDNPEINQLLDEVIESTDQGESKEIFREIQALFLEDVPIIKLGDMHSLAASTAEVKNFDYFYELHFWNVSKE